MIELKPCPFCKGRIRLTHGDVVKSRLPIFKCKSCGAVISFDDQICNIGAMHDDDSPAIIAYNTRAEREMGISKLQKITGTSYLEAKSILTSLEQAGARVVE